jgi:hypothetical protein
MAAHDLSPGHLCAALQGVTSPTQLRATLLRAGGGIAQPIAAGLDDLASARKPRLPDGTPLLQIATALPLPRSQNPAAHPIQGET